MLRLIFLLFSLTTSTAFSQQTTLNLLFNGVTTHFNYGSQNSRLKDYRKGILGAQLGASFQAGVTNRFSLVPELYAIMKGGRLLANNPLTTNQSTVRLYTLELPVLARLHMGRFYLNGGPYVTYALGGTMTIEGTDVSQQKKTALNFGRASGTFNRWEAGAQVGAGYVFPCRKKRLALDVRYSYGLSSVSTDIDRYNRYLNVGLLMSQSWATNPLGRK
ncbi:porin family protein [Spirosoma sp. SC4-14]|uniref:porin family protein n=1 Tax=Spirosoma sp. SC4-14 TaxID=3128900 RepID=UPI0030D57177